MTRSASVHDSETPPPTRRSRWIFLAVGLIAGAIVGRVTASRPTEEDPTPALATYAGGRVTAGELEARLEQLGTLERGALTAQGTPAVRALIDTMVLDEVLASAAREKGLDREPKVRAVCERALVDELRRREFNEKLAPKEAAEADLRAAFSAQQEAMSRPEQVRVAYIFLAADPSNREQKRRAANTALQEARRAVQTSPGGFNDVARARSEDPVTGPYGGELPYLTRAELEKRLGAEVAAVAFEVKNPGQLHDSIIETPKGFFVLQVLDRENEILATFEAAAPRLRAQVLAKKRAEAEARWEDELRRAAEVHVDDEALAKFAKEVAAKPK